LNTVATVYDTTDVSVPAEILCWQPATDSVRVQQAGASDREIEALVIRLENDEWISLSNAGSYRHLLTAMLKQAQNAVSGFSLAPRSAKPVTVKQATSLARGSPEALLKLVESWLAEDDDYDTDAWPMIEQDINENRLSERSRFDG